MADANKVLSEGTYVPTINSFAKIIDSSKVGFVGLNKDGSAITTFDIKEASDLTYKVMSTLFSPKNLK